MRLLFYDKHLNFSKVKINLKCINKCSKDNFFNVRNFCASSFVSENIPGKHIKPTWIEFSHARIGNFLQKSPKLQNPFLADFPLQRYLDYHVPKEVNALIVKDLRLFGRRIAEEIDELGWTCELHLPVLRSQDAWGNRIDELETCSAWKSQHDVSAEEGLVSIGYERKLREWSRLHQVCKLYMYAPSSGLYSCPLAMTDGAAKTIEVLGVGKEVLKKAFENLTTRDPTKFWTSGQWMTEKKGGSDVSNGTETVAISEGDIFRLYGCKWFTSAADSNMALALAREVTNSDDSLDEKGLTLFYLETKNAEGQLNNIQLMRLKNKLGTRQLPTAELLLDGTVAHKISEKGHGVSVISNMLNITRLYNAVSAVGYMRRIIMLARDYSQHRIAFGKPISQHPLHMQVLSRMEVEVRGSFMLLLKTAILLGKVEVNTATEDEILLLRLLLPLLKLYTAKQAVSVVSEGLEAFGGQGYMEETRLPVILRDAQVLPIWEGTTNIIALDVLRSFSKSNFEVLKSFEKSLHSCLELGKKNVDMHNSCTKVENGLKCINDFIQNHPHLLSVASRDLAFSLARTYIGALLIENAYITRNSMDLSTAQRWCELQDLCPILQYNKNSIYEKCMDDAEIVMEGYTC